MGTLMWQPTHRFLNTSILYLVLLIWYDAWPRRGWAHYGPPRMCLHQQPSDIARYYSVNVTGDTGSWTCERQPFGQIFLAGGQCALVKLSKYCSTPPWSQGLLLGPTTHATCWSYSPALQLGPSRAPDGQEVLCFSPQPALWSHHFSVWQAPFVEGWGPISMRLLAIDNQ